MTFQLLPFDQLDEDFRVLYSKAKDKNSLNHINGILKLLKKSSYAPSEKASKFYGACRLFQIQNPRSIHVAALNKVLGIDEKNEEKFDLDSEVISDYRKFKAEVTFQNSQRKIFPKLNQFEFLTVAELKALYEKFRIGELADKKVNTIEQLSTVRYQQYSSQDERIKTLELMNDLSEKEKAQYLIAGLLQIKKAIFSQYDSFLYRPFLSAENTYTIREIDKAMGVSKDNIFDQESQKETLEVAAKIEQKIQMRKKEIEVENKIAEILENEKMRNIHGKIFFMNPKGETKSIQILSPKMNRNGMFSTRNEELATKTPSLKDNNNRELRR